MVGFVETLLHQLLANRGFVRKAHWLHSVPARVRSTVPRNELLDLRDHCFRRTKLRRRATELLKRASTICLRDFITTLGVGKLARALFDGGSTELTCSNPSDFHPPAGGA